LPSQNLRAGGVAPIADHLSFARHLLAHRSPADFHPVGELRAGHEDHFCGFTPCDVLVVFYTDQETMALLDVMTGNPNWNSTVEGEWCSYGHNFAKFKSSIQNPNANTALKSGAFGAALLSGCATSPYRRSDLSL
jgi:hypothetical protein